MIQKVNERRRKAKSSSKSSHPTVFCKKDFLKNLKKLIEKHLCWSLLLIELPAFRSATLLKRLSSACDLGEIYKRSYFVEHLRKAAFVAMLSYIGTSQKQSFTNILQNRCSLKFGKFHRKTPVLDPLFNKVAGLKTRNLIKETLQRRYFSVKFAKFLRTLFY